MILADRLIITDMSGGSTSERINLEIVVAVTYKPEMLVELVDNLADGAVIPKRVNVIDNTESGSGIAPGYHRGILVSPWRDGKKRYCNESWNVGISLVDTDTEYVLVMNDDLLVNRFFLERVLDIFERFPDCGVACPGITEDASLYDQDEIGPANIVKMRKREGGAFTIKKAILDKIPPIPFELRTYYGDDWIWHWSKNIGGFQWMKDQANIIFHKGSVTIKHLGQKEEMLQRERFVYSGLMDGMKKGLVFHEDVLKMESYRKAVNCG